MSGSPYQWRADGGYRYTPIPSPAMYYVPAPPPQVIFIPGPIGVYGVTGYVETPPTYEESQAGGKCGAFTEEIKIPPPPPPPLPLLHKSPPPNPSTPEKKKEENNNGDAKKDQAPKYNFYRPPPQHPATNYMFPLETTKIHIFNKGAKVWQPKYQGVKL